MNGEWCQGIQIEREADGGLRVSTTSLPDDGTVVAPAFVNVHSHFEYFGMELEAQEYWPWIREISQKKLCQTEEWVTEACRHAARENVESGIGFVVEHSDRPGSAQAMAEHALSGLVLQEVITLFEHQSVEDKLAEIRRKAERNGARLTPHAPYTVDSRTLGLFSEVDFFSMHVCESVYENQFYERLEGPIVDLYRFAGADLPEPGRRTIEFLDQLGLLHPGAQFVHCCDINDDEVDQLAESGVSVAHCPRSNAALQCKPMPIRRMLDAGVQVGLGLDSTASSGPISMIAEMNAVKDVNIPEVWFLATTGGAASVGLSDWAISDGCTCPLNIWHAESPEEVMEGHARLTTRGF